MIFLYELMVYIPSFLGCFLLSSLMLSKYQKKAHYKGKIISLLIIGTIWQIPISALIYLKTPGFEVLFGIFKFILSFAPFCFFVGIYRIKFLSEIYIFILSVLFYRWTSVFAGIVVGFTPFKENFYIKKAVSWIFFAMAIIPIWYFYIRKVGQEDISEQDGITILLFVLLFSLFEGVMPIIRKFLGGGIWELVFSIFELVFFLFMLYQSVRVSRRSQKRAQMMVSDALMKKEKQQFEQLKQNMESMKAQVHDMKYILRAVEEKGPNAGLEAKLTALVNTYEQNFNTGDAALDVILSDAGNNMHLKKIRFECLTETCNLSFMENYDLYSFLGNAFDNAVEYLLGVDEEKRFVSFKLENHGGFLFFEVSNYYEGRGDVFVGMKTSKKDSEMHGYGIRNMQRAVNKYGGELSVRAEGNLFTVSALIPVLGKNADLHDMR